MLVVGDVMLDEFVWGRVSRISPEAPVPVVEVQAESSYPGGAANVARNLRPFCAGVLLCGVVGEDSFAAKLRELLEDYGKGFLCQSLKDRVCALAKEHGKFLTGDPNPGNHLDWSGVDLLKPNRSEAFAMAGRIDPGAVEDPLQDAALLDVGSLLLKKWDLKGLLVTLGEHGMILFEKGAAPYHTPTKAREVFDVSGAGDTAIALYTLAICAGATAHEAAEISNHASGVVVAKLGTATLAAEELVASFEQNGK